MRCANAACYSSYADVTVKPQCASAGLVSDYYANWISPVFPRWLSVHAVPISSSSCPHSAHRCNRHRSCPRGTVWTRQPATRLPSAHGSPHGAIMTSLRFLFLLCRSDRKHNRVIFRYEMSIDARDHCRLPCRVADWVLRAFRCEMITTCFGIR